MLELIDRLCWYAARDGPLSGGRNSGPMEVEAQLGGNRNKEPPHIDYFEAGFARSTAPGPRRPRARSREPYYIMQVFPVRCERAEVWV